MGKFCQVVTPTTDLVKYELKHCIFKYYINMNVFLMVV